MVGVRVPRARLWGLVGPLVTAGCGGDPPGQAGASLTPAAVACPDPAPSYKGAVAAIVQAHCLACHAPGSGTYSGIDLSSQARLAREKNSADQQVGLGLMPKGADAAFAGGPRQTLRAYLACGAPDN